MEKITVPALQFKASTLFGLQSNHFNFFQMQHTRGFVLKPLVVEAKKANTRQESAKVRTLRFRKKFNGDATKPRLSVFCSDKQLYAMLVDDQNKKCLFYGSTLQKSVRDHPTCSTKMDAARLVGEELVKACIDLKVDEISRYDRNGFSRGERMEAFEIAISQHVFIKLTDEGLVQLSVQNGSGHQDAARLVGEELVKACIDLKVDEISRYDRNGFSRGERMEAFEIAISQHGFLMR